MKEKRSMLMRPGFHLF